MDDGKELDADIPNAEGYVSTVSSSKTSTEDIFSTHVTAPTVATTLTPAQRVYAPPTVVSEPVDASDSQDDIDIDAFLDAEKQTKIALSALQFQDADAAIGALQNALERLQHRRK